MIFQKSISVIFFIFFLFTMKYLNFIYFYKYIFNSMLFFNSHYSGNKYIFIIITIIIIIKILNRLFQNKH